MLLLKIRELAPDETDDGDNQALEIDENGVFQLKKLDSIRGRKSSVKALESIQEEDGAELSSDSLEQDYFDSDGENEDTQQ